MAQDREENRSRKTRPQVLHAWGMAMGAALLPLGAWPALVEPFQTPKRFLLHLTAAGVVAGWLACPRRLGGIPGGASLLVLPLLIMAGMGVIRAIPGSEPVTLDLVATSVLALGAAGADRREVRLVAGGLATGIAILSFITCLQSLGLDLVALLGGGTVDWSIYADKMRRYGTMGNPNMVGFLAALGLPVATGLAATSRRPAGGGRGGRWRSRLWPLAALLMAATIFITFSKAAMVAAIAGLLLLWLMAETRRRWSWRRRTLAATALAAIVSAFVLALPHHSRGQDDPDQTLTRPWREAAGGRLALWREGLTAAGPSPVWGLGPTGLSRRFASRGLQARHVHNDYIQVVAEGGLVLFLCSVIALATTVRVWRRRRTTLPDEERRLHETIGIALCAGGIMAVVDFPLHRPAERALLFLLAGLVLTPAGTAPMVHPLVATWGDTMRKALASILLLATGVMAGEMLLADRLLWRAEGLEQCGHHRQAEAAYREAARHGANPFRVHLGLGRMALHQERFTMALGHARAAHQLFPDPAAARLIRRAERYAPTPDATGAGPTGKKP